MTRQRLDLELVARGLAGTRSRARDLILRGAVTVDGAAAGRPGALVSADAACRIAIAAGADAYVSRAAYKLIAGLDAFGFDPAGRVVLDIGASTGGFTEVLLARGAARVYSVDVGHGQLVPHLVGDARVVVLEKTDARRLDKTLVPEPVGAIAADVSFISLAKALPAALALAASGAFLVALVKPQFEVGLDGIGKGGIVRDAAARTRAVADVEAWIAAQAGWQVVGRIASPIAGGDGNQETLVGAVRS